MILDKIPLMVIENSPSILGFMTTGSGNGVFPFWDRYLTIAGKKSYHMGVACSECSFSFERIDEDSVSINKTINSLSADTVRELDQGFTKLNPPLLEALKPLVPHGHYYVVLSQIVPTLVTPHQPGDYFAEEQVDLIGLGTDDLPHYTRTKYYRLNTKVIPYGYKQGFFEFLIPLLALGRLDPERVSKYENSLTQGMMPTIVTLGFLDVGELPHNLKREMPPVMSHTCLSHYIIAGRHKAYAAAMLQRPITMISFISLDQGSGYAISECVELL